MRSPRLSFLSSVALGALVLQSVSVAAQGLPATGANASEPMTPPALTLPGSVPPMSATDQPAFPPVPSTTAQTPGSPGSSAPLVPASEYPGAAAGAGLSQGVQGETLNLDAAGSLVDELSASAGRRLDQMVGASGVPADNEELVERMLEEERRARLLRSQTESATLAVELWGLLYNNEHAQALRTRADQQAAAEAARIDEERRLQQSATVSASQPMGSALAVPGAFSAAPVPPSITEINGNTARILTSTGAEMVVSPGMTAAGYRITSVSLSGVGVVGPDGQASVLGFATGSGNVAPGAR